MFHFYKDLMMYLVLLFLIYVSFIVGKTPTDHIKYNPGQSQMVIRGPWTMNHLPPLNIYAAQLTVQLAQPIERMCEALIKNVDPTESVTTVLWHYILSFMILNRYHMQYYIRHQENFAHFGTSDFTIQPSPTAANVQDKGLVVEVKRWKVNLLHDDVRNQVCDMMLGFEEDYGHMPIGVSSNGKEAFFYSCVSNFAPGAARIAANGNCDCVESPVFRIFDPPAGLFINNNPPFQVFNRDHIVELVTLLNYAFEFSGLDPVTQGNKAINPGLNPFHGQF